MASDEILRQSTSYLPAADWLRLLAASLCFSSASSCPSCTASIGENYIVLLETSGERALAGGVPPEVIKIVDVKCPDSGEPDTFALRTLKRYPSR